MDRNSFLLNSGLSGLLLALCVLIFASLLGRILGISGILGELLMPSSKWEVWRLAFILGLACFPLLFNNYSYLLSKVEMSMTTALIAGACVGFGTATARGCTSGHGLCGLARLSVRSLSAVLTFMLTGMVTRMLSADKTLTDQPLNISTKVDEGLIWTLWVATGCYLLILYSAKNISSNYYPFISTLISFVTGGLFAFGLMQGGMTQPQKLKDFLSFPSLFMKRPLNTFSVFDPALLFVMGGGFLPNLFLMSLIQSYLTRPRFASRWPVSSKTIVDGSLIIGSGIFGIGWALGGICPGPGIVVFLPEVLSGRTTMMYWWGSYFFGLFLAKQLKL